MSQRHFDTVTCAWIVTGTQPVQPSLACYESATSITWVVTCYESTTFESAHLTCAWIVTERSQYNHHLLVMSQRHLTQ